MLIFLSLAGYTSYRIYDDIQTDKELARIAQIDRTADSFFDAGDYASAKEWYAKNGRADKLLLCDYEAARVLMDKGELRAAKKLFIALGDYEDCAELAMECELRRARELIAEERYSEAMELLHAIEAYPGVSELIAETREELYQKALTATYACRFDEGIMLWNQLGDYKDATLLLKRSMDRVASMATGYDEPITIPAERGNDVGDGRIFWHRLGLIFVPETLNEDTTCMIFYPGGFDSALANAYFQEHIASSSANAIILYMYTNGFYDMENRIDDAYRTLEQVAAECNVFLHDMVVCGASNGSYTAVNTAAYLYENYYIPVKYVMSFDAGMHWAYNERTLTSEQCKLCALAGTEFLLFEGSGVGMNKPFIRTLVNNENSVTIVLCRNSGHYGIIYDAISTGMIDWALGATDEQPDDPNYSLIKLDKDSTYPN